MRPRHAFTAIALVLAASTGCGSSDDSTAGENGDGAQDQQDGDTGNTGDAGNGNTGEAGNGDTGDGNGGDGGNGQSAPPEVGSIIQGTAVAGNSGGDTPLEQSGEVLREGQRCFGHTPSGAEVWTSGLEEGASVTIRDAATGEEVGSGSVVGTSATQLESDPDDPLPVWECYFEISAEVSRIPDSFTVQVADLPPWPASFDSSTSRFVVDVTVPSASGTALPAESTVPPVGSTVPPVGSTVPPVGSSLPPPSTT